MKCKVNCLTRKQREIIEYEGRKAVVDAKESFYPKLEAMALWSLHVTFGFGKKRLLRWRKAFSDEFNRMCDVYLMDDCYPAMALLKNMGIDCQELVDNEMERSTE